jgi:hypothetical protein
MARLAESKVCINQHFHLEIPKFGYCVPYKFAMISKKSLCETESLCTRRIFSTLYRDFRLLVISLKK